MRHALRDTRCEVDISADFLSVAWRKLLQNAVAGLMVLAGEAGRDVCPRRYHGACFSLFAGGADGGARRRRQPDDGVPQEILAGFHRAPPDLSTSILTDREAGLPLEWDIRNGVVQRYGRIHHIPRR